MQPLTDEEVRRAGDAVLVAIGLMAALGHNSPAGIMDYVERPDEPMAGIVWDAFAATRFNQYPESRERLIEFADERGLLDAIADAVTR